MTKRSLLCECVLITFLLTVFLLSPVHAAERTTNQIAVTYVGFSGSNAGLWASKEQGLFTKNGLDVSVQYLNPTVGIQALIAGNVDLYAGGTVALEAAINGADIVYVGSILDKLLISLFSLPEIKDVSELKGKVIGVSQPGAPTYVGALLVLRRAGLVPDKDVKISYLKGVPETLAALQQKALQAGMINSPLTILARKAGLKELVDLGTLPDRFPLNAFIANKPYVGSHKDPLVRFFKGYVEGVRYARANPKQTIEIMTKYTKMTDPEISAEDYRVYSPFWEIPPFVNEAGIQTALSMSTNPKAGQFKPKDFIDNGIIQQLSNTGFFK